MSEKAAEFKQKQAASAVPDVKELVKKRNALNQESTKQAIDEFKTASKIASQMDKRLEKAKYMTGVAKASEQMASNERDMARIDGATQAMQEASQKVEKYTERIAMSEKTETQDE